MIETFTPLGVASDEAVISQLAVEYVELALDLHGVTVDRVLVFLRRVGIEMPETAAEERRRTHLPEQPVQCFGAGAGFGRQKGTELFREVDQDRALQRSLGVSIPAPCSSACRLKARFSATASPWP